MDQPSRIARFIDNWLGPCVVVGVALLLGLALFASEEPWWPPMAGPAPSVVAGPEGVSWGPR